MCEMCAPEPILAPNVGYVVEPDNLCVITSNVGVCGI